MRRAIYTGMSVMSVMLSVAASLAAPPLRWDTQQANPKAADWYIYRGEAVDLMPRLVDGTKPADITDTPATLRYREPALEPGTYRAIAATNTAPGTWLIPWRAEHDSGAPYYDYQLWIGDGPSASARITGKIIMRDSIGIPPGGPPPPPIAGYATPADLQAASNALANATATALTQAKEYTDTKIGQIPPPLLEEQDPFSLHLSGGTMEPGAIVSVPSGNRKTVTYIGETGVSISGPGGDTYISDSSIAIGNVDNVLHVTPKRILTFDGWYELPDTPGGGTIATKQDLTPAVIATILANTNGWITISNSVFTVHAVTNPAAPAAVIWSSAEAEEGIPPAVTNAIWSAISGLNTTLGTKADKAWGTYLPDGSANPEPAWATMLNAPVTLFGSGVQWATAGTYALLTTPGAAAVAASPAGGELRIGPDITTNFFGYRTGGSYLVGARTDGIKIFDGGTTNGYAELTYDTFADNSPPTIWFTPSLALDWSPIEPVWIDNGETATAIVPATTKTGFWRATTLLAFDSLFYSTMPAVFEGGIIGSTNAAPVVYDSTVTISVGGKSYRIPAEEVK